MKAYEANDPNTSSPGMKRRMAANQTQRPRCPAGTPHCSTQDGPDTQCVLTSPSTPVVLFRKHSIYLSFCMWVCLCAETHTHTLLCVFGRLSLSHPATAYTAFSAFKAQWEVFKKVSRSTQTQCSKSRLDVLLCWSKESLCVTHEATNTQQNKGNFTDWSQTVPCAHFHMNSHPESSVPHCRFNFTPTRTLGETVWVVCVCVCDSWGDQSTLSNF